MGRGQLEPTEILMNGGGPRLKTSSKLRLVIENSHAWTLEGGRLREEKRRERLGR